MNVQVNPLRLKLRPHTALNSSFQTVFFSTFGLLSERLENPNMVISGKLPTVSTPAPTAIYILCL